ncbi:MAG: HAD family hydrolase [Phycisphaerales bacterium]
MPPRYPILAIDLDGTLLSSKGTVSPANIGAVHRARAAGIRVVVCTGRGLAECRSILTAISQDEPVVVAGGAIIACPMSGRTLHRFTMEVSLVRDTVGTLLEHEQPALLLKDPADAGYDYLVVQGPTRQRVHPAIDWWFERHRLRVRYVRSLDEDEHPEHTVRVGACSPASTFREVAARVKGHASGRGVLHSIPAVAPAQVQRSTSPGEPAHIMELFDAHAGKWSAVSHLARQWGLDPGTIVAIGDEVNDVEIITNAGLGIAMANAVPAVRDAARRHTKSNDEDGVAFAVEQVLSGAW